MRSSNQQNQEMQKVMQFVAQSLQQNIPPQQIAQQLMQVGMSQEQAMQLMQMVAQQMQGMAQEQAPAMAYGGIPYAAMGMEMSPEFGTGMVAAMPDIQSYPSYNAYNQAYMQYLNQLSANPTTTVPPAGTQAPPTTMEGLPEGMTINPVTGMIERTQPVADPDLQQFQQPKLSSEDSTKKVALDSAFKNTKPSTILQAQIDEETKPPSQGFPWWPVLGTGIGIGGAYLGYVGGKAAIKYLNKKYGTLKDVDTSRWNKEDWDKAMKRREFLQEKIVSRKVYTKNDVNNLVLTGMTRKDAIDFLNANGVTYKKEKPTSAAETQNVDESALEPEVPVETIETANEAPVVETTPVVETQPTSEPAKPKTWAERKAELEARGGVKIMGVSQVPKAFEVRNLTLDDIGKLQIQRPDLEGKTGSEEATVEEKIERSKSQGKGKRGRGKKGKRFKAAYGGENPYSDTYTAGVYYGLGGYVPEYAASAYGAPELPKFRMGSNYDDETYAYMPSQEELAQAYMQQNPFVVSPLSKFVYPGMYADGGAAMGMSPEEQQMMMMQQQQGAGAPPSQEDMAQQGGGGQEQQIIQAIVQMLQQGMPPEQVLQQLVQGGVPQEMAIQLIQMVMQQVQQPQQMPEQPMPQQMPQQGGQEMPMSMYGGSPYKRGGSVGREMDVTPAQLEELRRKGVKFEII